MKTPRTALISLLLVSAPFALAGCNRVVSIAWEKDFERPIDAACIERGLRNVAPDVKRNSYVSDGSGRRGHPNGAEVTQFNYSDPTSVGRFSLELAMLPGGKTRYWHGWEKLGSGLSDEARAKVAPLLNRANQAVARGCGFSFEAGPRESEK